jgi:HEAT repeat protein
MEDLLLEALSIDQKPIIIYTALSNLSQCHSKKVVEAILTLVHGNLNFRWQAIETLGNIRAIAALPHLINLLPDLSMTGRIVCLKSLAQIGLVCDAEAKTLVIKAIFNEAMEDNEETYELALKYLAKLKAVQELIHILDNTRDNTNLSTRVYAAKLLGRFKYDDVIAALSRAVGDPVEEVNEQAVKSLGKIGSIDAVRALIDLSKTYGKVHLIYRAISKSGWPFQVKEIINLLSSLDVDKDTDLCIALIKCLGKLNEPCAIPILASMLSTPLEYDAIDALGKIVSTDSVLCLVNHYANSNFKTLVLKCSLNLTGKLYII